MIGPIKSNRRFLVRNLQIWIFAFVVSANALIGGVSNAVASSPPAVCTSGTDTHTARGWKVCRASTASAWLSHAQGQGGQFHTLEICNRLGYAAKIAQGGTCGNECGYCQAQTSCSSPGNETYDNGGSLTPDQYGPVNGSTVHWECGTFTGTPRISITGPASIQGGQTGHLIVTVSNDSSTTDAQTASMVLVIPANHTFDSATQSSGPAFNLVTPSVGSSGTVTASIAALPQGASATFDVGLKPSQSLPNNSPGQYEASINSNNFESFSASASSNISQPVPTLGTWTLIALGLLLSGFALIQFRRSRLA